ncbi:hypothetical protein AVEN_116046-1 [Araneus ventricosus]|uniref:Uncharacterized protein n=1 Tax=Araneus ventricosus TaxID=182803 RepID=A0A4Y2KT17_ARAVE|nr:hypothetical protein AVEN_116046-1 [Araneus ventricosus]
MKPLRWTLLCKRLLADAEELKGETDNIRASVSEVTTYFSADKRDIIYHKCKTRNICQVCKRKFVCFDCGRPGRTVDLNLNQISRSAAVTLTVGEPV